MEYGAFESIFGSDTIDNAEFDTIFGSAEDGELIDAIGQNLLFTESGEEILESDNMEDGEDDMEDDKDESMEEIAAANLANDYDEALDEGARFEFLPKFRKNADLRRFEKIAGDAEDVLNTEGMPTKVTAEKALAVLLRILDILENLESLLVLPSCVFIVTIPYYLLTKAMSYLLSVGQYAVAESYGKKTIATLNKLMKETKDPKVKKTCQEQIVKVSAAMKRMRDDDYEESAMEGMSTFDFEAMMESDNFEEGCRREGCGSKQEGCKSEGCSSKQEGCKREGCGSKQEGCKSEGCSSKQEGCKREVCKTTESFDKIINGEEDPTNEGCKREGCSSKQEGCKREGCKREGCDEDDDEECRGGRCDYEDDDDDEECRGGRCDYEDDDKDDYDDDDKDDYEDDDLFDTSDGFDGEDEFEPPLQSFNEKPCVSARCESEIDTPETTADLDRVMEKPGNARPDDIRDLSKNYEDNGNETSTEFFAAESVEDIMDFEEATAYYSDEDAFNNDINMEGDEDISPDSEGAMEDGEDIDSVIG